MKIKFQTSPLQFNNKNIIILCLFDTYNELISFSIYCDRVINYYALNSRIDTNINKVGLVDIFYKSNVYGYDLKNVYKHFRKYGIKINIKFDGKIKDILENTNIFCDNIYIDNLKFKSYTDIYDKIVNWYKTEIKKYRCDIPEYLKLENKVNNILAENEYNGIIIENKKVNPEYKLSYTGRLYTSKPNIQTYNKEQINKINYDNLYAFDYVSMHINILVNLSKDMNLCKYSDKIHKTISKMFIGKSNRDIGKKIIYSMIYNITEDGLARMTGININLINRRIKKVKGYFKNLWNLLYEIDNKKYNKSIYNRIIDVDSHKMRSYLLQSIESEILKTSIIKINELKNKGVKIVMLQHDKILLSIDKVNDTKLKHISNIMRYKIPDWIKPIEIKIDKI